MPSDTAQADAHRDPLDGAAAISPVTDEMMDHAAHAAAALADGVAHHDVHPERAAAEAVDGATSASAAGSAQAAEPAERAAEAARGGIEAAGMVASEAAGAACQTTETVTDAGGRAAEGARDRLSASSDALARYNSKVFEIARANMASTTALFAALVQAKSVPEAMSINADHLRRQMEALTSQGRELATLAQSIALDALQPFKGRDGR